MIFDSLSVIVSIFSIFVTYSIYQKYRLKRTITFIIASINIFLWNLSHVFYDALPEDENEIARIVWFVANIAGALIIVATIHGFSSLRHEGLVNSLIIYYVTIAIFLTAQLVRRDWYDMEYNTNTESWGSDPKNALLWNLYIGLLFIMLSIELFYPLIQAYTKSSKKNKNMIAILIIFSVFAMLSNLLLLVGIPQIIRYFIANLGLLGIFIVLYRRPFIGFYDTVNIHQIIIANRDGIPLFSTSDVVNASLASGALFGISSILDEIGTKAGIEKKEELETTRKIELATDRFFIITEHNSVIIYHYSQHSGVCVSKFTSLARIFRDIDNEPQEVIGLFQSSFTEYYPELETLIYPSNSFN